MSESIFPGGPVPDSRDRTAIALTKLLELFRGAIDTRGYLRISGTTFKFVDLGDTPTSYEGMAGKFVAVKMTEDGLEFVDGGAPNLVDLNDVEVTTADGSVLYYDAGSSKWKNKNLAKGDVGLGNVDNTSDANKPVSTAQAAAILTSLNAAKAYTDGKVVPQAQSDWNQSNATNADYIKNKPALATVATSGSYNDLADKPNLDRLVGAAVFAGTWDPATNQVAPSAFSSGLHLGDPIPAASSGNTSWYFVCSGAGSTNISGITDWKLGDWIISLGTQWMKIDNTDAVVSVNGKVGVVVLDKGDIGLGNVDNTSDANKPVSTAQAAAIATKQDALPSGSALQVLRKNAANTALEFATISTGGVDLQDLWMYSGF